MNKETETFKQKTEYVLQLIMIMIALIPVSEFFVRVFPEHFIRIFFWCYFLVDVIVYVLFLFCFKVKWTVPVIVVFDVILIVIFRDGLIALHIGAALAFYLVFLLFQIEKLAKYLWPIVSILMTVLWMHEGGMSKVVAVCLLVSILYALANVYKPNVRYQIPALIIMGIICMLLPAKEEPIKWTKLKQAAGRVYTLSERVLDEAVYGLEGVFKFGGAGYSGYSDGEESGGGVKKRERTELKFIYPGRLKYHRLKGGPLDETYNYWFADYINTLYHSGVSEDECACFSRIESAEIDYRYLHTRDIITPYNLLSIDEKIMDDLDKKHGKGFWYNVQYLSIDYASPYYIHLTRYMYSNEDEISDGDAAADEEAADEAQTGGSTFNRYESYEVISEYVHEVYHVDMSTFMPKEVYNAACAASQAGDVTEDDLDTSKSNDRIDELTRSVTKGCMTDFEKAKKIETYLRQYKYDTNVDLSDSDNMVDAFLFESQSGYCVHYAQSMVLMLRISGIPARYANGYLHNSENTDNVSSAEAHAWAEGYIEGLGWIPFEPTAANETAEQTAWGHKVYAPRDESKQSATNATYEPKDVPDVVDITPEEKKVKKDHSKEILQFALYILIMVLFIVLVIVVIKVAGMIRYSRLSPVDKVKENMSLITGNLDKQIALNYKEDRPKIHSLYDYIELLREEDRSRMKELIDNYYKIRFRGDEPEESFIRYTRKLALVRGGSYEIKSVAEV